MRVRVHSIQQLLSIIRSKEDEQEFLAVCHGGLRCWKRISIDGPVIRILHGVEGSYEDISIDMLTLNSEHVINRVMRGKNFFHLPEIPKEELYVVGA